MFAVCVPTYRRPDVCRRKTLKTLLSGGIPPERITLWVASAEEEAAYRACLTAHKDIRITVGVPGLAAQRAHIQQQFAPGTRLVFMDDDISMVKRLSETTGRLEKVTDLAGLFDRGFQEAEKAGAKIWGVYPAASTLYMSAGVSTDLRYLIGALYGTIVAPGATLRYGDNQEDKERTLRYWKRDGKLVRLNDTTIITRYYAPGGMDTPTRKAETDAATAQLVAEFPDLVRRTWKAKQGIWDLRFRTRPSLASVPSELIATTITVLPTSVDYETARLLVLEQLRKVRIPKLGKPVPPERMAHATRANVIGSIGRSATFGFGFTRCHGWAEFAPNRRWPDLLRALIEFGNRAVPPGWEYSTITLNHGVQAKKHRDGKNVGRSVIVGIGDYEGGALRVWDSNDENPQDLDIRDRPTMFNGALLPHETQPFTGERYTMIFYNHGKRGGCSGMPKMEGVTPDVIELVIPPEQPFSEP
jgi:hypothetical protein